MSNEKTSEEFEAWFKARFWHECYEDVKHHLFAAWQASRADIEVPTFSKEELNLFRQWFNAMEDLTPTYIEKSDCDLYSKVMEMLK